MQEIHVKALTRLFFFVNDTQKLFVFLTLVEYLCLRSLVLNNQFNIAVLHLHWERAPAALVEQSSKQLCASVSVGNTLGKSWLHITYA